MYIHTSFADGTTLSRRHPVTCGRDRAVRIWRFSRNDRSWLHEADLQDDMQGAGQGFDGGALPQGTAAELRDVAWAPNVGAPFSYIAAGSGDGHVTIWLQDGLEGKWRAVRLPPFGRPICRVQWSLVGTFLMVASADNKCSIWKEQATGTWVEVSSVGVPAVPHH